MKYRVSREFTCTVYATVEAENREEAREIGKKKIMNFSNSEFIERCDDFDFTDTIVEECV
jgi:hypothetical protein